MGTQSPVVSNVAGGLFTVVQQRVLGLLYGQPDRRFQSAELIRLARSGTGAVHRQLRRLSAAGLIETKTIGNQKYYRANAASPVFHELRGLIAKTVGVVEPIRRALEPYAGRIHAAFVYGSVASGTEVAESDVDLMIVSDELDHATAYRALDSAEAQLGRTINPTLLTQEDWDRKRAVDDSFVARVASAPRIMVLGTDDDLA